MESNLVNTAAEGLRLAREVNHPNIQLLVDYYHLALEKENPEIILEAGPAVRHLHFAKVTGRAEARRRNTTHVVHRIDGSVVESRSFPSSPNRAR